jgi:hypothetical protein
VRFVLLPGQRFETVGVAPLIDGLTFRGLIADKAFDSNIGARGGRIASGMIVHQDDRGFELPSL